jgi:hypothetical protein
MGAVNHQILLTTSTCITQCRVIIFCYPGHLHSHLMYSTPHSTKIRFYKLRIFAPICNTSFSFPFKIKNSCAAPNPNKRALRRSVVLWNEEFITPYIQGFVFYFFSELKIKNFEVLSLFSMLFSCMSLVTWDMFRKTFGNIFPWRKWCKQIYLV